jgi:hypothetical protein
VPLSSCKGTKLSVVTESGVDVYVDGVFSDLVTVTTQRQQQRQHEQQQRVAGAEGVATKKQQQHQREDQQGVHGIGGVTAGGVDDRFVWFGTISGSYSFTSSCKAT